MARQLRRGQIWTTTNEPGRRVVIYSGNMFNDLPDVPYVITMDIRNAPDVLDVPLPNGSRVCYTRIDHTSKAVLGENVGEVSAELMSKVNTNHFMVISTD